MSRAVYPKSTTKPATGGEVYLRGICGEFRWRFDGQTAFNDGRYDRIEAGIYRLASLRASNSSTSRLQHRVVSRFARFINNAG